MTQKDITAVEQMCMAGMSIEALYKIFKQFDQSDIKAIYDNCQSKNADYVSEDINISMNCS